MSQTQMPIPGARPIAPSSEWPQARYGNETELLLHVLLQHGPQPQSQLELAGPHLTPRFTRSALQRAVEQGTIRPLTKSGQSRSIFRITNQGRWALREHWAWRLRYPQSQFPDEPEDRYGMLLRAGRPPQPRPIRPTP